MMREYDMQHEMGAEFSGSFVAQSSPKMTQLLFGLSWSNHFPLRLAGREQVETIDYQTAAQFFRKNYSLIYDQTEPSPFLSEDQSEAKRRYYEMAGDFFAFVDGAEIFGIFTGTPSDWGSYYFRNCSILPFYQGGGRYQKLLKHLISVLAQHGVERIEGDVSPSNLGHIHVLNKLKFNITGFNATERWGALTRLTHFTSAKHERVFLNQFCHGVKPQLKG